ncbi:MAG: arginine repressor [Acidimicrobiia bacterium]|nr:arginine repressor [Acidimicrobiia bacterium]MYC57471.1 arginine repressor [Acidimicrobiia bacterium]MYG93697.1 arginine repressor [Acidimicrobiia bacterium]MYI30041.1 arginine repressor [Acidimicrobiia bacterium]
MSLSKNQRQFRIAEILKRELVASQSYLVKLLAADGVMITQATASRDLDDLGAVKVPTGGGSVYVIPESTSEQVAPDHHLKRVLGEWVVAVGWSVNLVVLHTPPGSAHVVGSAIDRSGMDAVLGTVAGDDTVLVIATEAADGETLAIYLRGLAGLGESQSGHQVQEIYQTKEIR